MTPLGALTVRWFNISNNQGSEQHTDGSTHTQLVKWESLGSTQTCLTEGLNAIQAWFILLTISEVGRLAFLL